LQTAVLALCLFLIPRDRLEAIIFLAAGLVWTSMSSSGISPTCRRKQLSRDLKALNRVRNKVMHPVRGFVPSDEDVDFVRKLQRSFRCA